MNRTVFDAHQAVKDLMKAGADERLAEALVNTVRKATTSGFNKLATKADLYQAAIGIGLGRDSLHGGRGGAYCWSPVIVTTRL